MVAGGPQDLPPPRAQRLSQLGQLRGRQPVGRERLEVRLEDHHAAGALLGRERDGVKVRGEGQDAPLLRHLPRRAEPRRRSCERRTYAELGGQSLPELSSEPLVDWLETHQPDARLWVRTEQLCVSRPGVLVGSPWMRA